MTEDATKQVEEFTAEATKSMEENMEKVTKGIENVAAFGQENVEAIVETTKIVAKTAENINAEIMAYSKKSLEDGMAAAKEMTGCKSLTEVFEKQNAFVKSSFDTFVSEANKLNEMYANAAKEIFAPMNARLSAAADAVKTYRA